MTSFISYLSEMTRKEALDILGITNASGIDLKKAYKKAAIKNHPDKGGSDKAMQQVNLAYEYLKTTDLGVDQISKANKKESDIEEAEKKIRLISKFLRESFNISKYTEYFQKFTNKPLTVTIDERKYSKYPASASYGITYNFSTDDDTVFYINISVSQLYKVNFVTSLGGGEQGVSFDFYTDNYVYHKKRKQKMKQRTWGSKGNTLEINDPKKLFPMKTMKDVFEGKKQRKFSKRDFVSGISKIMKGSFDGEWGRIPLVDDIRLTLTRGTFMRVGYWHINGLYVKGSRNWTTTGYWNIPETEAGLDLLIEMYKKIKKINNVDKMGKIIDGYKDKFKETY